MDPWSSQEISRILRNLKVHFHVHKRPTLVPIFESDQSRPQLPTLMLQDIHNIIFPYTPRSSMWSASVRFLYHNPGCTSLLSHTFHVPHCFPSLLAFTNNISWRVHFTKLLSMWRRWMTCRHSNKSGLIIPHVLYSKLDRGVQGPGGRSGTYGDVGITERACGLVPPTSWSEGGR